MRLLLALTALLLPVSALAQAPAAGKTRLTWLGHAAFLLQTPGGANLLIDPWLENPKAPKDFQLPQTIDAVLISHGHAAPVGQARTFITKEATQSLTVPELNRILGAKTMGGNVGASFTVKDATVHFVDAVQPSSHDGDRPGQYAGNPIGFVIEIRNGPTLYHAGDTGLFGDMELIGTRYAPQVALLPIGGNFTMGPKDAAIAAGMLKVKTVVPMHFGTFPMLTGTAEQLQQELGAAKAKAKMRLLEPGKTITL